MRSSLLPVLGVVSVGVVTLAATPRCARADQSAAPMHVATPIFATKPAPDSSRINTVLQRADQATASGRMAEARKLYRALIDEQRDASQYAGPALWRLATNHVYDGKDREAALLLEELAVEAARFGDPEMELRATFESAILWQKSKRNDLAMRHLDRVRALLQSPVISASVKENIERRIVG